jgi:hypothetical protein
VTRDESDGFALPIRQNGPIARRAVRGVTLHGRAARFFDQDVT